MSKLPDPPAPPTPRTKGKGDDEIKCVACLDVIQENDAGKLACRSSHCLCGECSAVFCESILSDGHPSFVFPSPKCSTCRGPIPNLAFERILTPEQLSTYLILVAMQTLNPGETLVTCVACHYAEIHTGEPPIFWCKNFACETIHCVGCKVTLPRVLEESDVEDSEDEEEYVKAQSLHVFHLKCSALSKEKAAFDRVISDGAGMPCPGCGVVGRKDNMCTHSKYS